RGAGRRAGRQGPRRGVDRRGRRAHRRRDGWAAEGRAGGRHGGGRPRRLRARGARRRRAAQPRLLELRHVRELRRTGGRALPSGGRAPPDLRGEGRMKGLTALFKPAVRWGEIDVLLAAVVVALMGFGVVMVYSASVIEATVVYADPQYFLKRQAIFCGVGLCVMLLVSRVDYHLLRPFTYPVLLVVTLLMVLSVIGFGHTGGGAARWLRLGPVHVQPSEAAKLALVLWLGYSLDKKKEKVKSFSIGMLPHCLLAGVLVLLCMKQPDFGGAVILVLLTFTLLFVAGA